jgi:hypothetical protein
MVGWSPIFDDVHHRAAACNMIPETGFHAALSQFFVKLSGPFKSTAERGATFR